ncbi:hypothetical protein SDRG_15319 [Saprolegnia diclina VS20]|uniref:CDC20/Fizzy WD40 domain-containing protein n=2 Tax=Saprolegnia TaxID=4769 RepID=T0RB79_SAPDV|nr:hypothetical protein SDRG_15319 [Saprolegnia diclina VS20]EQC26807.1 hypothetical protein SDRG_15319 [Saprolegnia diclina VS20]|eukprot:XP_008619709.1 hypothetical protein SDRG_15319 [Saprolegnia diclina VS20]
MVAARDATRRRKSVTALDVPLPRRALSPTFRLPTPVHGTRQARRPTRLGKQLPDRFIPLRGAMNLDYCAYLMAEPDVMASPEPVPTHRDMLMAHLVASPEEGTRLLRYRPRPRTVPEPLARLRHPELDTSHSGGRHIPTVPTRILDAPDLRDDYYLNLVAWGSENVLAVALGQLVYLYNVDTGSIQVLQAATTTPNDYVTSVAWTSDRQLAVGTCKAELQIWDIIGSKRIRTLDGHGERIGALSHNASASILASGSRDTKIRYHDLRSTPYAVSTLCGHTQEICGLAWSPDGKTLASGGNDNCLSLWDAAMHVSSPRCTLQEHTAAVKALAWCPWERHLLASGGGTADRCIKFWNGASGMALQSVHTGSQVCGLLWSPYERELLSSHGFSQNELCLWSYPRMARLREFTGHTARVLHIALSPDGGSVVSAAADETLRFWNVFTPKGATPARFGSTAHFSTHCGIR